MRTCALALMSVKRFFSRGCPSFGQGIQHSQNARANASTGKRARSYSHTSTIHGYNTTYSTSAAAGTRIEAPSYLYRSFMGHSSRFASMNPPLARADITKLEREPLTHSTPGRVNDHICICMIKTLRWIADRAFRERYIHRATMLVTVASAAPAAGSVAAYLRMFFKRRPTNTDASSSIGKRASVAAEVGSPFLTVDRDPRTPLSAPSASSMFGHASGGRLHHSTPNSSVSGASLRHTYVDELRGLLAQCECHAVHYQILGSMAEITAIERALVLLLQAFHFAAYLALFLFYPRMGFRLMAYTAEESSVVWTQMVNDIDLGKISELHVPKLALRYWGLEGIFTAQGALVPMIVTPKVQDVVIFKKEEKGHAAEAANSNIGGGAAAVAARPTTLKAEDPVKGDTPIPSKATAGNNGDGTSGVEPKCDTPKSTGTEEKVANSTAEDSTAGRQEEVKEGTEEPLFHKPVITDPSETVLTLRDVVLLIRSDEMVFRDLNHEMANELDTQPGYLRRLVDKYEQK